MTKESLLEEIKRYPDEMSAFNFIQSATAEELKRLGLAILYIISPRITTREGFNDEYSSSFGVSNKLKTKDKVMGNLLCKAIMETPNITVTDFFEKHTERIKKIEEMQY